MDKKWLYQKYIKEHKSMNEIAELLEKTVGTIHYWIKKHKIRSRHCGAQDGKFNHFYGRTHTKKARKIIGEKGKGRPAWNKGMRCEWHEGERNNRWNGGVCINNGYKMVQAKDHPCVDHHGYVMKHRLVMEKHLGRYLKPTEVVHHIDEDKKNNDINNLMLFKSNSEHRKHHCPIGKMIGGKKGKNNGTKHRIRKEKPC